MNFYEPPPVQIPPEPGPLKPMAIAPPISGAAPLPLQLPARPKRPVVDFDHLAVLLGRVLGVALTCWGVLWTLIALLAFLTSGAAFTSDEIPPELQGPAMGLGSIIAAVQLTGALLSLAAGSTCLSLAGLLDRASQR